MDFQRSNIRKTFIRYVNIDRSENAELENDMHPVNLFNNRNSNIGYNPHFSGNVNAERNHEPKKIDQKMFDKYNKSNTLCLHLNDRTTTMLRQIYEGKGWDVINDGYEVDHTTLHALIDSHERIVMLGHGTSWGLIGFIRDCCAEHLKGKKLSQRKIELNAKEVELNSKLSEAEVIFLNMKPLIKGLNNIKDSEIKGGNEDE